MVNIHIMVGVSGSGKTTIAKKIAKKENAVYLSSDRVRGKLMQNGELSKNEFHHRTDKGNVRVFELLHSEIKTNVMNGKSVVIDAKNLLAIHRQQYFELLKPFDCYWIAHVVLADKDECVQRIIKRNTVADGIDCNIIHNPQERTDNNFAIFEMPTTNEGLDEIRIIKN